MVSVVIPVLPFEMFLFGATARNMTFFLDVPYLCWQFGIGFVLRGYLWANAGVFLCGDLKLEVKST